MVIALLELEGGINSGCCRSPFKIGYSEPCHLFPGVKHGNEKAPVIVRYSRREAR